MSLFLYKMLIFHVIWFDNCLVIKTVIDIYRSKNHSVNKMYLNIVIGAGKNSFFIKTNYSLRERWWSGDTRTYRKQGWD